MNGVGEQASPLRAAAGAAGFLALLAAVGAATVGGLVVANGNLAVAVAPVAAVAAAYAITKVPVRWTTAVLLLLMLALDDSSEDIGQWHTPFVVLGDLLHGKLSTVLHVPGLAVSGMEVLVVFLLVVAARRRAMGSSLDVEGQVGSPAVLRTLALLVLVAVAWAEVNGLAHGLAVAPWKIRNLVHPILLFVLFATAFRGPRDHVLVGRIVVVAACAKALLAIVVQRVALAETGGELATATSHGDSVLLSVGIFLVLADWMERGDRRSRIRAAVLLPLLLLGAVENGRRLVWVMLLMSIVVAYALAPSRGWKRSVTRAVIVAAPILAIYLGVGWNRGGGIFGPIQTIRGVSDSSVDHSAYWREVENWNIAMSIRQAPLLGIGLGGEYTQVMANDDISSIYPEYREWPHNTILGLLLLMGVFAFSAVWSLWAAAVFLAARSYRLATEPGHRVAALGCLGAIIACHVMAYGDTGAHYPQYKIVAALALAFSGKLAVVTGAWPGRRGADVEPPARRLAA